jgi:phospho-N-acetylmuramoyl-pentapeptide-transferase
LKSLGSSFLLGLALSLVFGRLLIPELRKLKIGQQVRSDGPRKHLTKAGTPTIGGLIFILAIVVSRLVFFLWKRDVPPTEEVLILGLMLAYGLIGFIDDYRSVRFGRSLGLRAREKMALQILFAAVFLWFFVDRSSTVILPFSGRTLDLGIFYPVMAVILIVGTGNGMNFTDGNDGLAAGVAAIGLGAYYFISAGYAQAMSRPDLATLSSLALSSVGALIGFLYFNYNPAKVFMGDCGSLALGGLLSGYAIATNTEVVFLLVAAVQLVEVLSVMLQVASFQLFGKRIFKMAPLHHHFELLGWSEKRVVHVFWLASLAMAILGILSMAYV